VKILRPLLIAIGLIASGFLLFWMTGQGPEPVYKDKLVFDLVQQMLSPDPAVRDEATVGLRAAGAKAVPELIRLLETKDSAWREQIWQQSRRFSGPVRRAILKRIQIPGNSGTRRVAAHALTIIGPEASQAVPALVRALYDPSQEVHYQSAQALGHVGYPAVPAIAPLAKDTNSLVRLAAIRILGDIRSGSSASVSAVVSALDDEDHAVQLAAVRSLGQIGSAGWQESGLPDASTASDRDPSNGSRAGIMASLERAIPLLCRFAHQSGPEERVDALRTLYEIRAADERVIEACSLSLEDPSPNVRLTALRVLGRAYTNAAPAVPVLIRCLADEIPENRAWAARVLGRIGAPAKSSTTFLEDLQNDTDPMVRTTATEALKRIAVAVELP